MGMVNKADNSCSFGAFVLGYLFREIALPERDRFETHLISCSACIDELAELSEARYAVYEWKTVEFVPLATPEILIPIGRSVGKASWLNALRSVFDRRKTWALAGGLASLIVLSVVGFVVTRQSAELAKGNTFQVEPASINAVAAVRETPETKPDLPAVPDPDVGGPDTHAQPRRKRSGSIKTPDPQRARRETAAARTSSTARLRESVTLGEYTDDRDDGLRLTDLFDDIGSRDLD